jgi:hypothetical protein
MREQFEEEYKGFTIYIEPSADRWNPGYQWSMCRDGEEYDTNTSFTIEQALKEAKNAIDELPSK